MVAQARKIKADCRLGRADLFLLQLKQSAQRAVWAAHQTLLTLAVAKMPKLSLPPLAAMSPQLTILTGLSPNLVSTLMPLTISSLPMAVISPVLSTLIGPLA
jgi:hypothetical protein